MMETLAQRKLLHTSIISVAVKQHLAYIGRMDGPTEYSSSILPEIRLGSGRGGTWGLGLRVLVGWQVEIFGFGAQDLGLRV